MSTAISPLATLALGVLGLAAIFFHMLPMQLVPGGLVVPDILLALCVAWVLRRPDGAPLLLVAALVLLADLTQDQPTGLWALLSLFVVEASRGHIEAVRNRPFLYEWGAFAGLLALALVLQALVLTVALVPRPPLDVTLQLFAMTVVAYPLVVAVLHLLIRIRAPKPAERSRRLGRVA
ncbi:MAG: rod shape-determining protein MreD [Pseudomonadota bacterium]